ncbi:MAG TPA: glycosyltransferase family 1 protein [Gammaproteobacteria bacterium]|nr:glycosyltransferase family 1 protein [Gammaproteobacteria bacterium]
MARVLVLGSFADSLVLFRGPLLTEMVRRGHQVYACAPGASAELRRKLSAMGVVYCDVALQRTGTNPLQDLRTILELIRLCRRIRPELFLGYTIKPVLYGSLAARVAGVARRYSMIEGLGFTFMGSGLKSRLLGAVTNRMYRLALGYNEKVFFLNPDNLELFLKRRLLRHEGQAVMLNGIGVDLERFRPAPFPQRISFLLIARLLKDKGVREYAAAARHIRRRHPAVSFRLVGWIDRDNPDTIDEKELESWVDSGDIEFVGRLDDVRPALRQCSVYVLPSYHEGMPVSVLEAMAMGRPVITTDAPGCRETVHHGETGMMVPVADVDALVRAMEYFIQRPDEVERCGRAGRMLAEQRFDVHKVNAVMLHNMRLGGDDEIMD